jgi:hypothetical protein
MTISKGTAAGGLSIALLLGLLLGRWATPAKVVEKDIIVETTRDTELTWHAYVGHTERKVEEKTNWKTVTEWKPGDVVTQTVYVDRDRTENTRTDTATTDGQVKEKIVEKLVYNEKLVESKKPDWLFSAKAGLLLDERKPVYGGEVGRRILGPVFLGAWGQAAGASLTGAAAGVGVTVLW